MSRTCLTSLQQCNRARWQMLFHPTVLTLEYCDPLNFGQICISYASWALTGCNVTHSSISSWLVQRVPSPYLLHPLFLFSPICCELFSLFFKIRTDAPQNILSIVARVVCFTLAQISLNIRLNTTYSRIPSRNSPRFSRSATGGRCRHSIIYQLVSDWSVQTSIYTAKLCNPEATQIILINLKQKS